MPRPQSGKDTKLFNAKSPGRRECASSWLFSLHLEAFSCFLSILNDNGTQVPYSAEDRNTGSGHCLSGVVAGVAAVRGVEVDRIMVEFLGAAAVFELVFAAVGGGRRSVREGDDVGGGEVTGAAVCDGAAVLAAGAVSLPPAACSTDTVSHDIVLVSHMRPRFCLLISNSIALRLGTLGSAGSWIFRPLIINCTTLASDLE